MNVLLVFTILYSVMNTDMEMDLAGVGFVTLCFVVMFAVMSTLGFLTAKLLRPGDVLAYTGPMGAGKTTFTVGLARGLGSSDWVSSPTFALVQEYRGPVPLCHFDFYRITGVDDLYATGFFDYLDGTRVLAVEWSERIPDALPEGAIRIRFEPLGNDCRRITISTPAGDDRLAALPA